MSAENAILARTVEDATCTHCGCLCDDITLTVEEDRIIEAKNACNLGESWFFSHRLEQVPACLIEGKPAPIEGGVERAAQILAEAKYPIICGLVRHHLGSSARGGLDR